MKQNIPWEKLAQYFAGEMTEEERKEMENWIKADPEREEQIKFLHNIWEESKELPYLLNVDKAWETLEGKIVRLEKSKKKGDSSAIGNKKKSTIVSIKKLQETTKKSGKTWRNIAMIAASALIMLMSGLFTHHYFLEMQEVEATEELAIEELTTRDGERAVYTLSDGSRVILHAGSRLEVPVNFNTDNRDLYLEGEAYFEVSHDPGKPFIVNADKAYTRVLGTKFLVQAWPETSGQVEVIVEEGKVALGGNRSVNANSQQEVVINRNQKGVFTAGTSTVVQDISDLHWHLGWTEGRLVFEDRQLSEIIPRLERWYAVDIQTASNEISEKRLTAEIDYSQPMKEVLMGIALSLDLDVERDGRTVIFRSAI